MEYIAVYQLDGKLLLLQTSQPETERRNNDYFRRFHHYLCTGEISSIWLFCFGKPWASRYVIQDPSMPSMYGPALPDAQAALFYQTFYDAVNIATDTALYWPQHATTDPVSKCPMRHILGVLKLR